MNVYKIPIILFMAAGMISPCSAQIVQVLTWEDCINTARKNNSDLIIAKQSLQISEYSYNNSWNNYYPSLSLGYGYSRSAPGNDSWDLSLSASQTIFNWKSISDIKAKKATVTKSIAELISASASARYAIRQAFLKMQYAQESLNMYKSIYEMRAKSADIVRLQYEGGKESKGNMMRSQAQKHSAYMDVVNSSRELESARRTLSLSMGIEMTNFLVAGTLEAGQPPAVINVDAASLGVPQVVINQASVDIAKEQLSSSWGDVLPSLSASASLGWKDNEGPFPDNRSWSYGLRLSYPLFGNGLTSVKNNISSARVTLAQNRERLRKALLSAKTDLQNVQAKVERTYDNVETYQMFLDAAVQRQQEANIKYLAGTMEFQTWQDIEQELVNSQLSHLSALSNYNTALAERDNLLGVTIGE